MTPYSGPVFSGCHAKNIRVRFMSRGEPGSIGCSSWRNRFENPKKWRWMSCDISCNLGVADSRASVVADSRASVVADSRGLGAADNPTYSDQPTCNEWRCKLPVHDNDKKKARWLPRLTSWELFISPPNRSAVCSRGRFARRSRAPRRPSFSIISTGR